MDIPSSNSGPDNPDLILSLIPSNRKARKMFKRSVNWRHYHRHASTTGSKEPVIRKDERQTTPQRGLPQEEHSSGHDESTLQLSFAHPPRHPPSGYVFGSDPDMCDIFLGSRATGISSIYFSIKYTREGLLVLHSQSETNEIKVSYDHNENAEQRSEYVWVLFSEKPNITVTLVNELVFSFRFPSHGDLAPSHRETRDTFINNTDNECLSILQLNRNTHRSTEDDCGAVVPFNKKVYTKFGELGAGTFGIVHELAEASTAARFAMKTLFPGHVRYAEYRVAREALQKEAATLAGLVHRRIVRYYGVFKDSDSLCMVMEFLPQGDLQNLLDQTGPQGLSDAQASVVLWQGLEALEYLHENNVTHRDLKPKNIMVVQFPLLKFKLVDFGLSHAPMQGETPKFQMMTFCGTYEFLAPEQCKAQLYTNKVDIWALAVVIMYCLSMRCKAPYSAGTKLDWCNNLKKIIDTAAKRRAQAGIRRHLANILSHHMIQLDVDHRRSARELLKKYDPLFIYFRLMETAVESRNPQVSFEFDAELTDEINVLENGLECHCMWENMARDTTADCGDPFGPDAWIAYSIKAAREQPWQESGSNGPDANEPDGQELDAARYRPEIPSRDQDQPGILADEEDQPLDLFHDQNGQPLDLFGDQVGQPPTDWPAESELARAMPSLKHSRQASNSSEASEETSSKKRCP